MNKKVKYIIGVDEVGRGPLAGPVTVCAAMVPRGFVFGLNNNKNSRPNDSKKLSAKKREEWFLYAKEHGRIFYATSSVSPAVVDKIGISRATALAVERSLKKLSSTWYSDYQVEVLLDGLLHAPAEYKQKTIIKGDEIESIISLASIIAKVTRDKYMTNLAKKYPEYGFEKHKGYGTKKHYECIKKHGISEVHRRSFLMGLQK
jgi:ribonuclease HII